MLINLIDKSVESRFRVCVFLSELKTKISPQFVLLGMLQTWTPKDVSTNSYFNTARFVFFSATKEQFRPRQRHSSGATPPLGSGNNVTEVVTRCYSLVVPQTRRGCLLYFILNLESSLDDSGSIGENFPRSLCMPDSGLLQF